VLAAASRGDGGDEGSRDEDGQLDPRAEKWDGRDEPSGETPA